jgi:hypothetical protein
MVFKHDDIQRLLFLQASKGFGFFNQSFPSTYTSVDSTDPGSRVLSMHENAHQELNNNTVYGSLLGFFAELSIAVPDKKEYFSDIVALMIDRSREAHEAYATWFSVTRFMEHDKDNSVLALMDETPDYRYYYELAERLVKDVPGLYLRLLVLFYCNAFCFQSKKIGELVLDELPNFSVASIRNAEFPDQRFFTILEHIPSSALWEVVKTAIEELKDPLIGDFLTAEMAGGINTVDITHQQLFDIAKAGELVIWDYLNDFFEQSGSSSYLINAHTDLYQAVFSKACSIYSLEPIPVRTLGAGADDVDRNMIINYENETILFTPAPIPCAIKLPSQLTEEDIEALRQSIDINEPLVLSTRYCPFLEQQYAVTDKASTDWFEQNKTNIVTFFRFALVRNDEKLVIIVPCADASAAETFIAAMGNRQVNGCIYLSTTLHDDWENEGEPVFDTVCQQLVYINDVSLLYTLEKYYPRFDSTTWCKTTVSKSGTLYSCLVHILNTENGYEKIMMSPSSDVYAELMAYYSNKHHKNYQAVLSLAEDLQLLIENIYKNIYAMEHSFYFRTAIAIAIDEPAGSV